jgi:hypothetical protein
MVVFVAGISACMQLNPLKPKTGLNGPPGVRHGNVVKRAVEAICL